MPTLFYRIMLHGLLSSASLFGLAILTSLIEIEIDPYGWTTLQNTTWHRNNNFVSRLMGKPLTGYHLFFATQQVFMLFLGLVTLYPYLNTNMSGLFMLFCSYFPLWNVMEDFGWFVLNPYFGVKNFQKKKIWWHNNNIFIDNTVPVTYIIAGGISFIFACLSGHFLTWLQASIYCSVFMWGLIQVAPIYHEHYYRMRWNNYEEKKPNFDEMYTKQQMHTLAKSLDYYNIYQVIKADDKKLKTKIL